MPIRMFPDKTIECDTPAELLEWQQLQLAHMQALVRPADNLQKMVPHTWVAFSKSLSPDQRKFMCFIFNHHAERTPSQLAEGLTWNIRKIKNLFGGIQKKGGPYGFSAEDVLQHISGLYLPGPAFYKNGLVGISDECLHEDNNPTEEV